MGGNSPPFLRIDKWLFGGMARKKIEVKMYGSHFPTARYPLLRFTTWCTMHHVKSCLIGILTGVNTTCIRVQHDAYKTIYKRQNRCFIAMLAICSSSAARKNLNFCHKSWNSYTDRLVSGKKRLSVSGKKKKTKILSYWLSIYALSTVCTEQVYTYYCKIRIYVNAALLYATRPARISNSMEAHLVEHKRLNSD